MVRFAFSSVDFFVEKKITLIEFPNSNKVVLKFLARLISDSVIMLLKKFSEFFVGTTTIILITK